MKRILAAILVLLLTGMCISAYAVTSENYPTIGLSIDYPDAFVSTKGLFIPNNYGMVMDGLYYMQFDYYGITLDTVNTMLNSGDEAAIDQKLEEVNRIPACVVVAQGDVNPDEIFQMEYAEELGKIGDFTFYMFLTPADETEPGLEPEFAEEYAAIQAQIGDVIRNARFSEPLKKGAEMIGQTLSFTTKDTEGNDVDSETLFASHEVTMVNVWASWCPPCIGELSELAETNKRLAEYDCGIIGILIDGDADSGIEAGKSLMTEHGVDYPVLLPGNQMDVFLNVEVVPTTFFISREGIIMSAPMEGVPSEMTAPNLYETTIYSLLGIQSD